MVNGLQPVLSPPFPDQALSSDNNQSHPDHLKSEKININVQELLSTSPLQQLLHFVQQKSCHALQQQPLHVLKKLLHVTQQQSWLELQQQSQHVIQPKQLRRLQMRLYFFPKM